MSLNAPINDWHVWTIRPNKFDLISAYIEEFVPEIKKILYPTVKKEKITKKGKKVNYSPLYAAYIFLHYRHDSDNPTVWGKLERHPFITGYVGPCTAQDLASVDSLQKVEEDYDDKVKNFNDGDRVKVSGGVFLGYFGVVYNITSNSVAVEIDNNGKPMKVIFSPGDLVLVAK